MYYVYHCGQLGHFARGSNVLNQDKVLYKNQPSVCNSPVKLNA